MLFTNTNTSSLSVDSSPRSTSFSRLMSDLFVFGGIIGISNMNGITQRLISTSHITVNVYYTTVEASSLAEKKICREVKPLNIEHDECGVNKCYKILNRRKVFEESDSLVTLSSGKHTPLDIQNNLERAGVVRKSCLQKFVGETLISKEIPFYDSIKKNKLQTFASMRVKVTTMANGKEIILKADRITFSKFLVIHEKQGISFSEMS